MTGTALKLLTFDDFERLPDQPGKLELLRGELIELPPAKRKHNEISRRIFLMLLRTLEDLHLQEAVHDLGAVYFEMGYRLEPGSWLQPDVSITRAQQRSEDYFLHSPALAVEVVSAGNTADEMEGKIAEYLAYGAREVWVVFPKPKHIRVYTPDGTGMAYAAAFRSELLGGALIDPAALLAD